jgi:hypothetical protein
MKKYLSIIGVFIFSILQAQTNAFNDGERMLFKVKYGFISAGYGELKANYKGDSYHFSAKGWSNGFFDPFFKVRDFYDSYTTTEIKPYFFKRDVTEGSYKKKQETKFEKGLAISKTDSIRSPHNIQDLISFFYFLRTQDLQVMPLNESIEVPIYLNDEIFNSRFIYKKDESIKTILGKVDCMVFKVDVSSGRVFGEGEPLHVWVTKDKNKIPVLLKADIAVGSIKMILDDYDAGEV